MKPIFLIYDRKNIMNHNQHQSHIDRYEPTRTARQPTAVKTPATRTATPYQRCEPSLHTNLRFVKPQNHTQEPLARVSEKWLSNEAYGAFMQASQYVGQLVMGEQPQAYEAYVPGQSRSFYVAMGIGVRTYLVASSAATGQE